MCTRVLALLALYAGLAHSFSWDIVVGEEKTLKFYYNGTVTHVEDIASAHYITAVMYDPVHFRVLFVDYENTKWSIYSFDIPTRKMQTLVIKQISVSCFKYFAYEPLTQLLFWTEDTKIYSLSLKPASSNEEVDGNLIATTDYSFWAIGVDSCGGYVYWTTENKIERAAFDGSEREVLIDAHVSWRPSLVIDRQTEKMYWIERAFYPYQYSIESANLNGKNRKTMYFIGLKYTAAALTVSKDFIYWRNYDERVIVQLPKHQLHDVAPVASSTTHCSYCPLTAANYTIEEQTMGNKSCVALKTLIPDVEERHGSICHNYCFQGNCSVSAEGHPICRCNAGYSGERCEVNACHQYCSNDGVCSLNEEEEPVCQCTADYEGKRCHVATTHTGACVCADNMTQQILLEVKQVREDLQCTLQLYTDKLDENEAKLQICEESRNDDQQNYNATMSKPQTSSMKF